MRKVLLFAGMLTLLNFSVLCAQEVVSVSPFKKVIVSPHVQVNFVQGTEESVVIQDSKVSRDKVNIEVQGGTLRVYLEGAKEVTKNEKMKEDGMKRKQSLYQGTNLTLTINYKTLNDLSVRGEELIQLKSKVEQNEFRLKIYGEAKVYFDQVRLNKLYTTIYGESYLELKSGAITEQRFTTYGESNINAIAINNKVTHVTAYGESDLELNVSDQLKVTAFGETKINYKGNPVVKKGITIGHVSLNKIQ